MARNDVASKPGPSWVARGAKFAIGVALVVGIIALAIAAVRVLLLVLVAIILAAGLQPVVAWLRGKLGLGRGLQAADSGVQ